MFVFILCASVFLVWFSILIFTLIIYFFIFYFCWKSSFFYAIYKNDGQIKKYLFDRSFFLYLQISLELKKVYKKIVIFYYISGYLFTFFFYFIFYDFVLSLHFFCPYFLIYIIFLFKLLFFFFLNFTLNSRKPWRERVYINCYFGTRYDDFLIYIVHWFFFSYIMHIVNVLNW
jgi:hypothetical protein